MIELLGYIGGTFLVEIIFSGIGWGCLLVWYRNRRKVEAIKNKEYAGSYSAAGQVMLLNLVAGVGAVTMFGIVIGSLGFWAYKAIANQ